MEQFLSTKFFIPRTRPDVVSRPRLHAQLEEGLYRKLTLISAPAGFGKTTLVSEWLAQSEQPTAWLSMEKGDDNNPLCFLGFLIAALQTITKNFGEETLKLIRASQAPAIDVALTSFINELAALPKRHILVLDDYHLIEAPPIHEVLAYILETQPPQLHIVITTREDPPLPLARLRAKDQLTELRVANLRFTSEEADIFLNQMVGDYQLSTDEVASLEKLTEGWIAGLQLAALSMRGREDIAAFIEAFSGTHRYIIDYLVEEVLQTQPADVRSFLLRTSILDRFNESVCDAVTGQAGSKGLLETLERSNVFVVALDDRRMWFRYHHLFSDVLYAHLLEEEPDLLPTLHRRASEWYEQHDTPDKAIHHAAAGKDHARTAALLELAWPRMEANFQTDTWLGWVKTIPGAIVRKRPVLSAAYAWALLNVGQLARVEGHLQSAERWLGALADGKTPDEALLNEMIVVDEAQFDELAPSVATARAYLAQALGNVPQTIEHGLQALAYLNEEAYLKRGIVSSILSLAYLTQGDLEEAYRHMAEGMENMRLAGNLLYAIRGTYSLADIRLAQGRLSEAIAVFEQSIQEAEEAGEDVVRGAADLYFRLSELYWERGAEEESQAAMLKGEELAAHSASPHWQYRISLAKARLFLIQGELEKALDFVKQAETQYVQTPMPDIYPPAALKARIWIAQGKLTDALGWARGRALAYDDALNFLQEVEYLTFARLLIARYRQEGTSSILSEAHALLGRLREAAENGGRTGNLLETLILQAMAYRAEGKMPLALEALSKALTLAQPEGYRRIFTNEGAPVAALLSEAAAQGITPAYCKTLLASIEGTVQAQLQSAPSSIAETLIDPLSERELEILQLIALGLSNSEISERLFLALSTIKGHNRNIYSKLQVNRRTEAVARGQELGLL